MKHTLYILIFYISFTACGRPDSVQPRPGQSYKTESGIPIVVIEFDGCEYLAFRRHANGGLEHKGNCKNYKGHRSSGQ